MHGLGIVPKGFLLGEAFRHSGDPGPLGEGIAMAVERQAFRVGYIGLLQLSLKFCRPVPW